MIFIPKNKIPKTIFLIVAFGLWLLAWPASAGSICPDEAAEKLFSDVIAGLKSLKEEPREIEPILRRWEQYCEKTTAHTPQEYQAVLETLDRRFRQAVDSAETCAGRLTQVNQGYSPAWIDKLSQTFGRKYVVSHEEAITRTLLALSLKNDAETCIDVDRRAVYLEAMRARAYRDLSDLFTGFLETLDAKERHLMAGREQGAQKIVALISEKPLTALVSDSYYRSLLSMQHVRRHYDQKFVTFMTEEPILSRPFDVMKALDDLKAFIQEQARE